MRWRRIIIAATIVIVGVGGFATWRFATRSIPAGASAPPSAPQGLPPVTAGVAQARDVPVFVEGLGTVQAFNTVAVRSRVDGQITDVLFKEGQEVKKGDPLFQIDRRPFAAALAQAQAAKQRDEASLKAAQLDLNRYAALLPSGFQARQIYEQQQGRVGELQGSIQADQAQIDAAQLNLEYSLVRSPIDGRTGRRMVDVGNVVQASQNVDLVTVTQLKPIFVTFPVPADRLDDIRNGQSRGQLKVTAYAMDNQSELANGVLTLIDNQVDVATGTIRLKGQFDNEDERLWPGQFVDARVVLSTRKNAVTVSAETVMQGPEGPYVYILNDDNSVNRRKVHVAATQDGLAVISSGLSAGERVVTEGQYRLTDGAKVNVSEGHQAGQDTQAAQ